MDWSSSKGPSWDWPEEESFLPNNNNDGSDVDLKLGSIIASSQTQLGGSSSTASNFPSKRARAAANSSTQTATSYCLVDGCTSDLSNYRDYHRRHKVCEVHSKTPEVTIQGRKQRFCQQCSRFHAPEEFDEGKRSCRKRLDGHNRRRRKSQPETQLQQGTYLPNFPGAGMLSFSNPPCYSHTMTTSLITPKSSWSGSVIEHNTQQPQLNLVDKQIPFTDYSSSCYTEAKQLTFMQGGHHHAATPQSSDHKVFYDGLTQAPKSDCALSLLSQPQMMPMHMHHTAPNEINFRNAIPVQPHTSSADPSSLRQPITVSGSDVNFQHMFQTETDVPNPQTLPFYWE